MTAARPVSRVFIDRSNRHNHLASLRSTRKRWSSPNVRASRSGEIRRRPSGRIRRNVSRPKKLGVRRRFPKVLHLGEGSMSNGFVPFPPLGSISSRTTPLDLYVLYRRSRRSSPPLRTRRLPRITWLMRSRLVDHNFDASSLGSYMSEARQH